MAIRSRTFNTTPGTNRVGSHHLSGIRIFEVKREGINYERNGLAGSQTNREFQYFASSIYFNTAEPFNVGEKIWVLYET